MDCVQHSIGIMNHKPSEKQWESSNRLSCDDIQHCFSLPPYIVIPHQKTWCEIPNKKQYGISENKVGDILIQCSSEASWNLILHLLYQWVFSVFPFIPVFPNWIVLHIYIYMRVCMYLCLLFCMGVKLGRFRWGEERRLRVFLHRVLRRIFWPKRGKVTG